MGTRVWICALATVAACGGGKAEPRPTAVPSADGSRLHMPPAAHGGIECGGCGADLCWGEEGVCCNTQMREPCTDEVGKECPVIRHCDALCCDESLRAVEVEGGTPWTDAEFRQRLKTLAKWGRRRIGAVGGGPVMPSIDTVCARVTVKRSTVEQLRMMVASKNPAIRAHAVREIAKHRKEHVSLLRPLVDDDDEVLVGSMSDIPPIEDSEHTIADLVKRYLSIEGLRISH